MLVENEKGHYAFLKGIAPYSSGAVVLWNRVWIGGQMRAWKYAICNEGFEGWSLEKVSQTVAKMGYEGVELAPFTLCKLVTDLSADDRRGIRQAVEGAGLRVAGVHWLLAQTPFRLNVPDAAERKKA